MRSCRERTSRTWSSEHAPCSISFWPRSQSASAIRRLGPLQLEVLLLLADPQDFAALRLDDGLQVGDLGAVELDAALLDQPLGLALGGLEFRQQDEVDD